MENFLDQVAIVVALVGLFKALEWLIKKITDRHDKEQQIDKNSEDFESYKAENDKKIKKLTEDLESANKNIDKAHMNAQKSLDEIRKEILDRSADDKKEIIQKIADDREEYLKGIEEVKQTLTEMSSLYQQNTAIVEIKIDNLEKKQDLHNSVISRMYECEKQVGILDNREKVSEHRLTDIEQKMGKSPT